MDQDKYPSWMLPIVALFAMVLGVNRISTSPPTNDNTPEQTAATEEKKSNLPDITKPVSEDALLFYEHDAFHILRNFFETENLTTNKFRLKIAPRIEEDGLELDATREAPDSDEASHQKIWNEVREGLKGNNPYRVDYMIVGVPDPEASMLRMETDWTLDMVQRGLEASLHRFVLDRFDLPWRLRVRGQQAQAEEESRRPDEEPGLMLFRCGRNPYHRHLLLVFLVGETPTAGVHKTALTRAIAQIVALTALARTDPNLGDPKPWQTSVEGCRSSRPRGSCGYNLIPVLGPHFTGSDSSYLLAFQHWNSGVSFDCVTGSATGISPKVMNRGREILGYPSDLDNKLVSLGSTQGFDPTGIALLLGRGEDQIKQSFAVPNRSDPLVQLLLSYLNRLPDHASVSFAATQWPDFEKIMRLRTVLEKDFQASPDELAILTESNTSYGAAQIRPTNSSNQSEPIVLPFPMHISRLRNSKGDSGAALPNSNNGGSRPFLPLTTTEKEEEDLLPPFSQIENISNWRVLESVLDTVRREKIRFVVIRATNIEDVIFLAREIERYCPDTMIFLLSSDDLLLNPDAISSLRSTIMLTSYPLLAYEQEWSLLFVDEPHRVVHFPVQGAEGTYNAVLALLSKIHSASGHEDEEEEEIERMLEYRNPFDHKSLCCPPLWMTVVGDDAMWPVKIFPVDGSESDGSKSAGANFVDFMSRRGNHSVPVNAVTPSMGPVLDYLFVPPHGRFESGDLNFVDPSPFAQLDSGEKYKHRIAVTFALSRGTLVVFWILWALCAYFALVILRPELWLMGDRTFAATEIAIEKSCKKFYLICFAICLWLISLLLCALSFFPSAALHWAGLGPSLLSWQWSPHLALFALAVATAFLISCLPALMRDRTPFSSSRLGLILWPFASVLLIAGLVFYVWKSASAPDNVENILTYFRHANVGDGVSIFLPMLYLVVAATFGVFASLRRLMLSERIAVSKKHPYETVLGLSVISYPGLKDAERRVNRIVRTPSPGYFGKCFRSNWRTASATAAVVLFGCIAYGLVPVGWNPWTATIECGLFYTTFLALLLAIGVLWAWELTSTFEVWRALKDFLDRVSGEPFLRAFEDEKDEYSPRPKFSLSAPYSDRTVIRLAMDEMERAHGLSNKIQAKVGEVRDALHQLETCDETKEAVVQRRMDLTTKLKALTILALGQNRSQTSDAIKRLLYYRVFDYSQRIAHAIRNLLVWATGGLLFLLLSISSYPFPNNDALLRFGWIFILTAILISMTILIGMNRERVLSKFAGGRPGKIDWNSSFVFHMLILALLPLLGIIGIQFPATFQSTTSMIGSWFNSVPHQ
jgi:hypothetical protein